jgi:Phosphodiester glycosidase
VLTGSYQGATFSIARMNAGDPTGPGIAAFSQRGGRAERPSGSASPRPSDPRYCAARLIPTGDFRWSGTGDAGVARSYVVEAQPEPCPKTPIAIGSDPGALVLSGRGGRPGGDEVKALRRDDRIRVAWRIRGWPGVVDVIGSQPVIVKEGRNVGRRFHPGASYFFNHNPRTALGAGIGCADARPATICSIFILTVDGRAENRWSKGMRLPVLASELIRAGAYSAVNIDGGGGTVMWVAERSPAYCETAVPQSGCLVTRPSDHGNERVAVVSVGVKPAPDTGEPTRIRG